MPLITCPDCGRQASDQSPACPACGRPLRQAGPPRVRTAEDSVLTRNRGCADLLIYSAVIILVVLLLAGRGC